MFSSIPAYGALQLILADHRLEQLRPAQFLIRGLPKLNIIDVLTACLVDLALRCAFECSSFDFLAIFRGLLSGFELGALALSRSALGLIPFPQTLERCRWRQRSICQLCARPNECLLRRLPSAAWGAEANTVRADERRRLPGRSCHQAV